MTFKATLSHWLADDLMGPMSVNSEMDSALSESPSADVCGLKEIHLGLFSSSDLLSNLSNDAIEILISVLPKCCPRTHHV